MNNVTLTSKCKALHFDVSQTSGEPLPTLANMLNDGVDDFEKMRDVLIAISPVPISFEEISGTANGYFSPSGQCIVVRNDMSELQTIKTMIHEIAHATLGHGGKEDKWDRETKEVQALYSCFYNVDFLNYFP